MFSNIFKYLKVILICTAAITNYHKLSKFALFKSHYFTALEVKSLKWAGRDTLFLEVPRNISFTFLFQ